MTPARSLICAALTLSCATGVVACGSGDDGKNAAAAAAVSQTFLNVSAPGEKMTTSQAACFGTGIIKNFGIDPAVRYGFLTKDHKPVQSLSLMLTTKDAGTYADLYLSCADPRPAITSALVNQISPTTSPKQQQLRTCLTNTLTRAMMRSALAAAASGSDTTSTLAPVIATCGRLG